MSNAERKLRVVESFVRDMYNKINENGGHYVVDLSYDVEELVEELELNTTFDATEIKFLEKAGYRISKSKQIASREFKMIPVFVEKTDFSYYILRFGKSRRKGLEQDFTKLEDAKSTSLFFKKSYRVYKR